MIILIYVNLKNMMQSLLLQPARAGGCGR